MASSIKLMIYDQRVETEGPFDACIEVEEGFDTKPFILRSVASYGDLARIAGEIWYGQQGLQVNAYLYDCGHDDDNDAANRLSFQF